MRKEDQIEQGDELGTHAAVGRSGRGGVLVAMAVLALCIGVAVGTVSGPQVPASLAPYLPIAVVAALDALFGGIRAFLDGIFDSKVFVVSFVFNVLVSSRLRSWWSSASESSATPRLCVVDCSVREGVVTEDGRHKLRRQHFRSDRIRALVGTRPRSILFGSLTIVLMVLLGFGLVVQVRENDSSDSLDAARPADLLVVLDNVGRREAALREEIADLEATLAALDRSDSGGAALADARARLESLSIQVGMTAATGPGVVVTVSDPHTGIGSDVLLDALQELRAAGAEAVQIAGADAEPVRIGVESWIAGKAGGVIVDGVEMSAPFVFTAIGEPATLAAALDIPGGVIDTVARNGGRCDVVRSDLVEVSALRDPRLPQYSQPGN